MRLEYVEGTSAKFWEAARDDVAVTVSWGRIGTRGQVKRTEFADVAAAAAFVTAQAAQKVRKGYRDVTGTSTHPTATATPTPAVVPASDQPDVADAPDVPPPTVAARTPDRTDEDTFAPDAGQIRRAYQRRDLARPRPRPVSTSAAEVAAVATGPTGARARMVENLLRHPESDPELAAAADRFLAGEPDDLGAAAFGVALMASVGYSNRTAPVDEVRDWTDRYGHAFAAAALLRWTSLVVITHSGHRYRERHIARVDPAARPSYRWQVNDVVAELRRDLASATDEQYAAARDRVDPLRTSDAAHCVAVFLFPTETGWLDDAWTAGVPERAEGPHESLVLAALDTAQRAAALPEGFGRYGASRDSRVIPTLLRTLGPDAAPLLTRWLDANDSDLAARARAALAQIPTDEAFTALTERIQVPAARLVVQEAAGRYPLRAVRVLADAAGQDQPWSPAAADLLRTHLLGDPTLLDEVVPTLPPAAREVAAGLVEGVELLPEAGPERLPEVLTNLPWTRPRAQRPTVVEGLTSGVSARVVWAPGEDQAALERGKHRYQPPRGSRNWLTQSIRVSAGTMNIAELLHAPMNVVAHRVSQYRADHPYGCATWAPAVLARFGTDAIEPLLHLGSSRDALDVLIPVLDERVAAVLAVAARSRTGREPARHWLDLHGLDAVPFLVPTAVGALGPVRTAAEAFVRTLVAEHGTDPVVDAVRRSHGDDIAAAIRATIEADPLTLLPARLPVPGAWADPAALPQIRLRDHAEALPASSVRDLITMLALGGPGAAYPGVEQVLAGCHPASVSAFGWALFEQWRAAGMPSKDGWALVALGSLGDDDTVRRLAPIIRVWPGEGGHARAVTGLDVLADIGTDVALMHLHGIAQKVKFTGLRGEARARIQRIADQLGLSTDELADRIVPDLGLAADGSLTLDYGPRRFVVGFDERLAPTIADEDGTRRRSLPKPGAKDDPELAPAAHQRFTMLKKDVRTIAADQVSRLERAMVTGRTWTTDDFRRLLVEHPLAVHLVRRLVWGIVDPADPSRIDVAFRVAEDRSFADVEDTTITLPADGRVCLAHPLRLGDAVTAWSEVFADYEILQPFGQLGRPVHTLTDAERADTRLVRFENVTVPPTQPFVLVRRGWRRCGALDGGVEPGLSKELPDGRHAVVYLDPGLVAGSPDMLGDQRVDQIVITDDPNGWYSNRQVNAPFGTVDAVSMSEIVDDLTDLCSAAL